MRTAALVACLFIAAASLAAASSPVHAQPAQARDLADIVQGTWHGGVTADMRGSSRGDVTVTVTKVGRNLVDISSDYARLPTVRVAIMSASDMIVNTNPGTTFLIERARDPNRLDLYIDGAALIVRR